MLDRIDDTIVAISCASGFGRTGIVRLSGPDALTVVDRMSRLGDGRVLSQCPGFSRVAGEVYFDGSRCGLPAAFLVFRAPRSYTRQDLIEIHVAGVPVALHALRDRAVTLGAIHAQPGEFTARAFLSGRISLTQAEGVASVIRAQTDSQLRAARRMMDGDLSMRVAAVRTKLAGLLALIEADIDFAEEPIEFITPRDLNDRLGEANADLGDLTSSARSVEQIDTLPRVLLLGPPNAGKSTLMNRLSKTDRAICAAVAGTTRDLLAASIDVGEVEAILLDSAGIETGDGEGERHSEIEVQCNTESHGEVGARSQAAALDRAGAVDVVCLVVDATRPIPIGFLERVGRLAPARIVVALNKVDKLSDGQRPQPGSVDPSVPSTPAYLEAARYRALGSVCEISALHGVGMDELIRQLRDALGGLPTTTHGEATVLTARQREAIVAAVGAVRRAADLSRGARETVDCADLLAFELREAVDMLGTITGELSTEDLLGQIFAGFCIGK